jgi:hypothetical protein
MPLFFQLSSWALGLILFAVVLGTTGLGVLLGRSQRHRSDSLREPRTALTDLRASMVLPPAATGPTNP